MMISHYDSVAQFVAAVVPNSVNRILTGLGREAANWKSIAAPASPRDDQLETAGGRWWERSDMTLTPEMFYNAGDGDNWAPAMQRMANAAEFIDANAVYLRPHYTYVMDDHVVFKPGIVIWAYNAVLYMRSNPGKRGGFVKTMGTSDGPIIRNDMVIYGLTSQIGPGVKGVNCFGTSVSSRVTFVDCTAIGATWGDLIGDPVKQGGRGFSSHSRSSMIKHINCRVLNCSVGVHILDKADYDTTPVLSGFTVTQGNPTVFELTNHGLVTGDRYQAQRFNATGWTSMNGTTYAVTRINANQFSLNVNSTGFLVFNGAGRLSKADTGIMRVSGITYIGMEIENCDINGLIFEQVLDSQNVDQPKNIYFQGRFKNCATRYPKDHGVITLAGIPGVKIDAQVFNDSAHPIGSVIRGAGAQCDIRIMGKVHTCSDLIDHSPATDGRVTLGDNKGNGLEVGSTLHPEGSSRASRYDLSMEANTITRCLVYSPSGQVGTTNNQNYTWRSDYRIHYAANTLGSDLSTLVRHATNSFELKNILTGAIERFGNLVVEGNVSSANVEATEFVRTGTVAVASLPSATVAGAGARHMVNNANSLTFNSVVAGGGTNIMPVFSDGTNWRIG